MKSFSYKYHPFGKAFTEDELGSDGIAADVGGCCFRDRGETKLVVDHHFHRECNFPSAAAAVLHLAPAIFERLSGVEEVKLITHWEPDFDAFCSLYLIRRILEGGVPLEGWVDLGVHPEKWAKPEEGKTQKINWYEPATKWLPPKYRAPVLLAAYASAVDQCKPLHCDRASSLHAILYAGFQRGRDWQSDGAYGFFRAAEERINEGFNPLFDALFDDSSAYAPDLALLRREERHYLRDIARARRTIVSLPVAKKPFAEWSAALLQTPLFEEDGKTIRKDHLCLDHGRRQEDGLFLRDPECSLFKEWARADRDTSPGGRGFVFTAIAYSTGMPDAVASKGRYIFSLDPEKADGAHLYPVWARLQAAEMAQAKAPSEAEKTRSGFDGRLGELPGSADPWYDGHSYQFTILDTPRSGTSLKPGHMADLSDDEAGQTARLELEWQMFVAMEPGGSGHSAAPADGRVVRIQDFPTHEERPACPPNYKTLAELVSMGNTPQALRFASVGLRGDVEPQLPVVAASIGKSLLATLAEEGVSDFPDDFVTRHLWHDSTSVAVWNTRGIAIASQNPDTIQSQLRNLEAVAHVIRNAGAIAENDDPEAAFKAGRDLLKQIIFLQIAATRPENINLRRLMECTEISSIVASIKAINQERFEENEQAQQEKRDMNLQAILAVGTAVGLLFAWNSMEAVSFKALQEKILDAYPALVFLSPEAEATLIVKFIFGILLAFFFTWWFLKALDGKTPSSKK